MSLAKDSQSFAEYANNDLKFVQVSLGEERKAAQEFYDPAQKGERVYAFSNKSLEDTIGKCIARLFGALPSEL